MKVRALKTFASPSASAAEGDVLELPAPLGVAWCAAGLVERVEEEQLVDEATSRKAATAETAVTRRKGRR